MFFGENLRMVEDLCSLHPFTGDASGWTATTACFVVKVNQLE